MNEFLNVYEYKDYEEYVSEQTKANKRKLHWEFPGNDHVQWIKTVKLNANKIICHGTRRGGEQKQFKLYYPDAYVIGTEISETATQFEMTVQHDFAVEKKEWIGQFDILYSNAFDHSYDPDKCIETWKKQLSPSGRMFLDWNENHRDTSYVPSDPVSGSLENFIRFLNEHKIEILQQHSDFKIGHLLMCKNGENNAGIQ